MKGAAKAMDPALITGATAVATGLLGYSGARLQHRAEEHRLEIEKKQVDLDQVRVEKELEEVKAQRREQVVEAKRALFCDYLRNAEIPWSLCTRHNPVSESEVDAWWVTYQGVRRQLLMASSEDIVEKARTVNDRIADLFVDLIEAIRAGNDDEDCYGKRIAVWNLHYENVEAALQALEGAMREDVAG